MNQALLRYRLPDHVTLYAPQFKELAAKALHESPLGADLFHYKDGKHITNESPDIRFLGGRNWVGLFSASGDVDRLMPAAGPLALALNEHAGQPVKMELIRPTLQFEQTQWPNHYAFREVACRKTYKSLDDEQVVVRMLLARLRKERDRFSLDLPGAPIGANGEVDEAEDLLAMQERLGIVIHKIRAIFVKQQTADGQLIMSKVFNGTLSMNLKITGIWQFGAFPSRGYGRLFRLKDEG